MLVFSGCYPSSTKLRPVFISGRNIFRGSSEWLVVLLEFMLKHYFTIATNSDEVQAHLQAWSDEWRSHSGFRPWPTLQFATLDIESLYPSIDLTNLCQVIKSQIVKYDDGDKARQVSALLDLVLRINDHCLRTRNLSDLQRLANRPSGLRGFSKPVFGFARCYTAWDSESLILQEIHR